MKLIILLICVLVICVMYMKYRENNKEMFEASMFFKNKIYNPIYRENLPITNKPSSLSILMDMDHRLYYNTCITNGLYKICYDEHGIILFTPTKSKIIMDSEFVTKLGPNVEKSMMYIEPNGNIIININNDLVRNTFEYAGIDNYPYMIAYDTVTETLGLYDKTWTKIKNL